MGAFASSCPDLWAAAEQAGNALRLGADEWLRAAAEPKQKAQKELARHERDEGRKRLLAALPPEQAAQLRSASGKGAGSWLLSPTQDDHRLADERYLPALALRLRLPRPADACATCQRRRADGQL